MQENKSIKPEVIDDNIGEIIEKIEAAKQKTALRQIDATDKDNERQYQFAVLKEKNDLGKWNKSFWIGTVATIILGGSGLYLLIVQQRIDIGLGLLSTTLSGVFGYIAGSGSCKKDI